MEATWSKLVRIKPEQIVFSDEKLKENDHQLYEKLKACISKRGQIKTVLVCEYEEEKYECLEGSKIAKALTELNVDEILCINLGKLSQDEKSLIKLEVFKDYFITDYVKVGVMLKELSKKVLLPEICSTAPYNIRQAKNLIELTEFDWESFSQGQKIEGQSSMFDLFEVEEIENVSEVTETAEVTEIIEEIKILEPEQSKPLSVEEKIKLMGAQLEKSEVMKEEKIAEPVIVVVKEVAQSVAVTPKEEVITVPYYVILNDSFVHERVKEETYKEKMIQNTILLRDTFSNCGVFMSQNQQG